MDQVKFVEDSFKKKLLGPFLNTLTHITISTISTYTRTRYRAWHTMSTLKIPYYTVKLLNSGHLWILKKLSVIAKCPLLGGTLKKIFINGTKRFVRYSWHVCYLGCPLLGGFAVLSNCANSQCICA